MARLDTPELVLEWVSPPLLARSRLPFLPTFFSEEAFVLTDALGILAKVGLELLGEETEDDSTDWPWESKDLTARAPPRTRLTRPALAKLFKSLRTVISVVPIIRAR